MTFSELGLIEPIVRAASDEGYTNPTPIQSQAIPHVIAGRDVFGCAQTGTGKTAAFAMPILQLLSGKPSVAVRRDESNKHDSTHDGGASQVRELIAPSKKRGPRALVLCPTRELAAQILESFETYGRNLSLRHDAIYGGVGQGRQVRSIRVGIDVLVATPGRLLDLMEQGYLDLKSVELLVLDEADRMLDMGFINDIRKVMKRVPEKRQTLFFSATVPKEIRELADSILRNPEHIAVARESTPGAGVSQRVYLVERPMKARLLKHVLKEQGVGRTLVFTRTKYGADKLATLLRRGGIKADAIHGNKSQNARTKALRDFRAGYVPVLVATDIASRGIDVEEITHVINFDMPIDAETYVHRIGRTARAGATGTAVSLCDREERSVLRQIERRTQMEIDVIKKLPEGLEEEAELPKELAALKHAQDHDEATDESQADSPDTDRPQPSSAKPAAGAIIREVPDHSLPHSHSHGHGHGHKNAPSQHPHRKEHAQPFHRDARRQQPQDARRDQRDGFNDRRGDRSDRPRASDASGRSGDGRGQGPGFWNRSNDKSPRKQQPSSSRSFHPLHDAGPRDDQPRRGDRFHQGHQDQRGQQGSSRDGRPAHDNAHASHRDKPRTFKGPFKNSPRGESSNAGPFDNARGNQRSGQRSDGPWANTPSGGRGEGFRGGGKPARKFNAPPRDGSFNQGRPPQQGQSGSRSSGQSRFGSPSQGRGQGPKSDRPRGQRGDRR